jgi:hypothetical protein
METKNYEVTGGFACLPSSTQRNEVYNEAFYTSDPLFEGFNTNNGFKDKKKKKEFNIMFVHQVLAKLGIANFDKYINQEPISLYFVGESTIAFLDESQGYKYNTYHALNIESIYINDELAYTNKSEDDAE